MNTVLIYVVIPVVFIAVVAALTLAGGSSKARSRRYRPGRPYDFQPIWFLSSPDQISASQAGHGASPAQLDASHGEHGASPAQLGTSHGEHRASRAQLGASPAQHGASRARLGASAARPGASRAVPGDNHTPELDAVPVEDSAGHRVLPGPVGGASDRW